MSHSRIWRRKATASGWPVSTTMPSATGVMQLMCRPLTGPSVNMTAHSRQAPAAPSALCQHSRGMTMPTASAASMTVVPLGTDTARPSMIRSGMRPPGRGLGRRRRGGCRRPCRAAPAADCRRGTVFR